MALGSKKCVEYEFTESLCRLGEVLLAFASGVLTMVTFGTPYWMVKVPEAANLDEKIYHLGLWQNCTVLESCEVLPLKMAAVPMYLITTRVFMSAALGAGLCAWLVCILALVQRKARWLFVSAIVYTVQGFSLMLGLASFSRGYHDNKNTHSGWSYTVGWIAFLFSLVCAAYFILVAVHRMRMSDSIKSRRMNTSQQNSYTPLAQFEQSSGSSSEEDEKL